jgi:hypothetical protein
MKNASAIIGLLLSFYFSLPLASHSQSLTRDFVLSELYGRQLEFDGEGMLVRKDPAGIEFRTALEKTLYYETNGMKKALVVLFSYEYDADMEKIRKGMEDACHACYPEFDLAYFSLRAGKWQKDRFIRSWEGASGTWGEGAQI